MLKYIYKGGERMGTAIVDAIKSAFTLLGDLAENFLTAFSTLFWDSTANSGAGALTVFGQWSLIMLGVAIIFSVLMLCLNLIRSNTGV